MFNEGQPKEVRLRRPDDNEGQPKPKEVRLRRPDDNDIEGGRSLLETEDENNSEIESEETVEDVISEKEEKENGDPIIGSAWMGKAGEFFGGKFGKMFENVRSFSQWKEEEINSKKVGKDLEGVGDTSLSLVRVGFVSVFKIVWGLLKFSYEAIKNKGKVPDAYKIGRDMFNFDKDKK